ncbi:rapamycin-insensitive companion of mTOR [Neocloeon triangulifer]|uniref:rapamycin-insensitive companion of mTOR n=1 Tax=Neocloeon triangulifer TaxID=2078957 RepID=UPI00286F9EF0|nr:rapamycin-insensitive companion of mTOR [Neocloeon triangulifer]
MSSWMYRGRSMRSNHSSSVRTNRRDSEDEYIRLDVTRDPNEMTTEILVNISRRLGISEAKKFGYLNACTNFFTKEVLANLSYNFDEILCCLRVALVHDAARIRATGIRTIRRLIKDDQDVAAIIRLRIPYLVARILDSDSDVERVQALRFCRRIILCGPNLFPNELARSLVSLANGGAEEKDKILRVCLATLAELAVMCPDAFITNGGVAAISRNLIESHSPRVTEVLVGSLLFLLVHQKTRKSAKIDLTVLSAPYCDIHYQHHGWASQEKNKEDRDCRIGSTHTALLSVLRSFPGILHFCDPTEVASGIKSLVDVLRYQHLEARKNVLDLFNDLLGVPEISWTDEASVALADVDPAKMQDAWKLSDGFVALEGKSLLPHLSVFRPNMVEIHKALLLQTFIEANLLEALIEVIVTSDSFISLRAAILLGQILQMSRNLLPTGCALPSLPTLISYASGSSCASSQQRSLSALNVISRFNAMMKTRPTPSSLFLQQLLYFSGSLKVELVAGQSVPKSTVLQLVSKDIEDSIKKSAVLANKDPFFWNWNVVLTILKSRNDSLIKLEDSNYKLFVRRLVEFFRPSNNRFSQIKLGHSHSHLYTLVACEVVEYLVEADEGEASRLLTELIIDIGEHIQAIIKADSAHDCLFSPHNVTHSMCQVYFLVIGRLCHFSKGVKVLEAASIFQSLLSLIVETKHDCYVKLVVSSLDFTNDGMPRIILGKLLKSPVESSRIYATKFLLVLVRAHVKDFEEWGMELLVMQLYDINIQVSLAASEILDEACDYKPYLEALVQLRPTLLQLGDRGRLLLMRFLSTQSGFSYLNDANFVQNELQLWKHSFNEKYVRIVEAGLHEALTMHQKNEEGSYVGRLSNVKNSVKDFYLPSHLYGQLVQHKEGLELISQDTALLKKYFEVIDVRQNATEDISKIKTAIWALSHISSSVGGINLLESLNEPVTLADCLVLLATDHPHYGVRASAFYACSLLATTELGCSQLESAGWIAVRQARNDKYPVIQVPDLSPEEPDFKFVTDDAGIWFEFPVDRRKRSTSHCSSSASAGPVITFEDEVDCAVNQIISSSANASPAKINGVSTVVPPLLSIGSQRSQTLPHSKPPKYQKHHKRSLSDTKGDSSVMGELPKIKEPNKKPERSPRVRSISVNSECTAPSFVIDDSTHENTDEYLSSSPIGSINEPNKEVLSTSWQDIKGFAALRLLPNRLGDISEINSDTSNISSKFLKPFGSSEVETPLRRAPSSLNSICRYPKLINLQLSSEPCFKGIALPADICVMFQKEQPIYITRLQRKRRDRESFCELEEVPEAGNANGRESPDSDSERSFDGTILHDSIKCISCSYRTQNPRTPIRSGKISTSSRHTRTDTESSEDFRIESFTLNSATLETATLNSNFSISNFELDMSQIKCEENAILSKCTVKKEILKHAERLSNPIWFKSSKQALLQLKQKCPQVFQDLCLYSDVCNLLENSSYRLTARKSLQELFYDCHFEELFDEAANILKLRDATSNLVFSPPSVLLEESATMTQESN